MILALLVAAGTVGRPYINFTEFAGDEYGQMGYTALTRGHYEDAVRYLRLALQRRGRSGTWYNLGLAYQELDRWDEAAAAYQSASNLSHNDKTTQEALDFAKSMVAEKSNHLPVSGSSGPIGSSAARSTGE